MMICPNCRTRISEDAVICDSCNHIIDASFLGSDITNEAKAAARRDGNDDGRTKVKAIAPPVPTPAFVAAVAADFEPEEAPRRSIGAGAAPPESVNEAINELVQQYSTLPVSERWATASAAIYTISLALPWRWTEAEDTVIGLFAGAWPLGLLAASVAVLAFARRQPAVRPYKAQLLAGGVGASLVVLIFTSFTAAGSWVTDVIHVGGRMKEVSKALPHFGLGIALLAALVMLGMSMLSFMRRDSLPDA